jgi:hypothetical protein
MIKNKYKSNEKKVYNNQLFWLGFALGYAQA